MEKPMVCSVGSSTNNLTCDLNVQNISELSPHYQELLLLRCNLQPSENSTVCFLHKDYFLHKYTMYQKKCCDLLKVHPSETKKASLRTISIDQAKIYKTKLYIDAIPGKKLCSTCRKRATELLQNCEKKEHDPKQSSDSSSEVQDFPETSVSQLVKKEDDLEQLNVSLTSVGVSPLKLHGVTAHRKVSAGKRKLMQVKTALRKKVACTLDVEEKILVSEKSSSDEEEIKEKASNFERLMQMVKEKIPQLNHREKIQMLTLVPESWSRQKVMETFNVSQYQVRQSRKLLKEKGLLSFPDVRIGKKLSQETIQFVYDFYEDDEFSRLMPGQKDKISIKPNVHVQKRLMLCNLKELYTQFKSKFPNMKIGFSKFADLRPKHCILAGSSGTHSVCVCTIHQNVQLLISAAGIEEKYQELIQKLVCNPNNRDCMLRVCSRCPKKNVLEDFLKLKFPEFEPDDNINYKQWVSTDRVDLTSHTSNLGDFINLLVNQIDKLIPHSYISKSQSSYLKRRKEELANHEALILMDFSENFSFILQDEAQGYHWTHGCSSLHTVVLYTKQSEKQLTSNSFCVLSDDMNHDVPMVYQTQKLILHYLKDNYPHVTNVEYFTDGCAAQYKNCKTFLNLCYHEEDFWGISAKWSFFATSHGKSVCDGVGGTVKRLVSKASLQRPLRDQISNVELMYEFCRRNIEGIHFFLISKSEMLKLRSEMSERLNYAITIPGTRSMHHFECTSHLTVSAKRVSSDENFSVCAYFDKAITKTLEIPSLNSYVACVYNSNWYIGLVLEVHVAEGDATIKFMQPHGPAHSYYWPDNDKCFVPFSHILCTVDINTTTGRTYKLTDESSILIITRWKKYIEKMGKF